MAENLKLCPFCGSKAVMKDHGKGRGGWMISCEKHSFCGVIMVAQADCGCRDDEIYENAKANTIRNWNTRFEQPCKKHRAVPPRQKTLFNTARKIYPGTKRGLDEEWDYLDIVCRKHKLDREQTVPKIIAGVNRLLEWRKNAAAANVFVPSPKNFNTWLFNRCWTDEFPALPHKKTQADKKKEYEEYEEKVKQYEG